MIVKDIDLVKSLTEQPLVPIGALRSLKEWQTNGFGWWWSGDKLAEGRARTKLRIEYVFIEHCSGDHL